MKPTLNSKGSLRQFLASATIRLMLTYLAIIMTMVVVFSVVNYKIVINEIGNRDLAAAISGNPAARQFYANARSSLRTSLVFMNLLILVVSTWFSYLLARFTLKPIEASMKLQNQFFGDASHELKTPITAIQTSTEVALRNQKLTAKQARKVIESNRQDANRLQELVGDFMRLARTQYCSETELEPVDLSMATNEALNQVLELALAKQITIDDRVAPVKVLAEETGLVHLIVIILENAIKYSPNKTEVAISSRASRKSLVLTIKDQGQGIPKDDLSRVFDRFYRSDESRRRKGQGGFGLGLAIAKQIVESFGGEINITSKLDRGTTIEVELKLA